MVQAPGTRPFVLITAVLIAGACRNAESSPVRVARTQVLPELDGRALKVSMIEVTYQPGESSAPHGHGCPVVGYVLDGAVRMQVKGERPAVYRRGDTFYEPPGGVHLVSA